MGEVYRACDTRLGRDVAIKILPLQVSKDPVRKQRFEREAKTISNLNHPHICVLHDIGSQDGVDFLVMECVEGETLAKRLEKSALPLEQVLKYGAQIADALDKAHRAGIVHRDLKPGNIMLTATGAKLLDFGLAKPAAPLTSVATMTAAVTRDSPVTEHGSIVGTFQYMSPEQIEGKELDGRSDIFSLGAVLYEMLTGQRAFPGKSQLSVASAILEKEPAPISSIKPLTPPALDHAIRGCLTKDPEVRWQTARDLKLELQWTSEGNSQVASRPAVPGGGIQGGWQAITLWGLVSLFLMALTALGIWNLRPGSPSKPVSRFVITLPPGQQLAGLDEPAVVFSPDGKQLAYVAEQSGTQQLYLGVMDSLEARRIQSTEGAVSPFFSPDGQWLGFFAGQKLKKVSVNGGAPITLSDSPQPRGASWNSEGTIAFASMQASPLQQISAAGGGPQPLTRLEKGEVTHRWPEFLPQREGLVFATAAHSFSWGTGRVTVQSLTTGERRNLIIGAMNPHYASSGHLLYAQGGNLMAVPFDSRQLAITGTAVPVVEGLLQSRTSGAAQYSVSATGSLAYAAGGVQSDQRKLVWVNRSGNEQSLAAPARAFVFPRVSPDGKQAVMGITEDDSQIWLYDLSRETLTRFTFEGSANLGPLWTPDGKRVTFQCNKDGPANIYWQRADGSGGQERLTTSEYVQVPMSWSADGQHLAFIEINPTTGYDIWVLDLADRKAQPFVRTPFSESSPRFSPDGHWLVYISNESGRYEVYVQPYPGPGGKWQISTEGGTEPMWNRNGRELFYRSGEKMMAVDVVTHPNFTAAKPRILFEGHYLLSPATSANYDVSPDGQRFLMLKSAEAGGAAPTQINVVLNWFEELKQRVPPGK